MLTASKLRFLLALIPALFLFGSTAQAAVDLPDGNKLDKVDFERHIMGLLGRTGCNAAEAENGRDQRDHEKRQGPAKHGTLSSNVVRHMRPLRRGNGRARRRFLLPRPTPRRHVREST